MKKIALLIGIVFLSMNIFAQNKGEMYVLTSASASFGKMTGEEVYGFQSNETYQQPMDTYFDLSLGYGVFVAQQFRLELALSAYSQRYPQEETGGVWLNNTYKGLYVAPSLAYYFKLADRFYYAPEIGASLDYGKYSHETTVNSSTTFPYKGYILYANWLSFQFRVSDHFALGIQAGDLQYSHRMYYYKHKRYYLSESLGFRWNRGSINALFYF